MIETDRALERRPRRPLMGKGGARLRGDNGVSPSPRIAPLAQPRGLERQEVGSPLLGRRLDRGATQRPAALEWREARLPLLGRLWATAWLPSILFAGCLVSLMYLLQTSGVATTGYDIQHLQVERDDWQLRNEQLRFELAKRQSLTWIESEASGRMGMVRAEPTALTYLKITR
jgi:hypothetical protein